MIISKQAVKDYLERKLNTYSWIKKLSKEEVWEELNQLPVRPRFKTRPWKHQLASFFIGLIEERWIFNLGMGAGKTKLMLDLISHYRREKKHTKRALVLVPRLINLATWLEATGEHSWLSCQIVRGTIEEKRLSLFEPEADVVVIDYFGLQLALSEKKKGKLVRDEKKIQALCKIFDFLVLDEIHKVKNKDSQRYGLVNQIAKRVRFAYGLTGTLIGHDVEDLVPQFHLIDRGETFVNLGMFRAAFCVTKEDYWDGYTYKFDPTKAAELNRVLQNKSTRYETEECVDLPECKLIQIKCSLGQEQRDAYREALQGLINANGDLRKLDGAWLKMREITSGYLRWADEDVGAVVKTFEDNSKMDALESLLESCGDSKIIVSHEYTETGRQITARLKELKIGHVWLYGGAKDPISLVSQFIKDPDIQVFVMNSVAGGTGTDGLQKVAKYLVFYESPCSPIERTQTERRVHRPGQRFKSFIYDLVVPRTVDDTILESIKEGKDLHKAVMSGRTSLEKTFGSWLTSN